ncbi:MAG TPA: SMP-30/gluconolactonase/LRE family protein [Pyrinomonadaceae bacterium]|nr:SMP-30/gluconolactonase/LRE family protein [Pyrinomonadaceae bacterium]
MRKLVVALLLLILLGGAIAFVVYRLVRKPLPTPAGWKAHVTTVAGDESPLELSDPFGVAAGPDGSIYFTDAGEHNRIQRIAPDGNITRIAGGPEGFSDGVYDKALFNSPSGLAIAPNGDLIVADTGNNCIRRVPVRGETSTVAGNGRGYTDGPGHTAQFNSPIGVAVDTRGNIYVADSYNDRIRMITPDGDVRTVAGKGTPGYADGDRNSALFDTPSGIVVANDNTLIVADTGNDRLRRITPDGNVTTLSATDLSSPIGLAITHDNFLYVTELDHGRVLQIAPDGVTRVIADDAHFNQPTGIAIDPNGRGPAKLYVADSGNYLIRKLDPAPTDSVAGLIDPRPKLTNETLRQQSLLWPIAPQDSPHEVAATMGEVRGSFDSTDSRHHLHSGLDVFGGYGDTVRAVRSEKVISPLPNWGFDSLNEGFRVGVVSYIHIHLGRDKDGKMFDDPRFIPVYDSAGKLVRVRVRRGARFKPGDAVGTINKMWHVHMNIGPPGGEINPLSLSPAGFTDTIAPSIEKDGIQLFDASGQRLTQKQGERLVVNGPVHIVVDAFDRTNMNGERRRLGLYKVGYQVLKADGTPAPGFNEPRINIVFNRLPSDREATKVAYADESGITVYGSKTTRFLYEVTNTVRDGRAERGVWDTSQLPKGDYVLRIIAGDYSGNEAKEGRDVLITVR